MKVSAYEALPQCKLGAGEGPGDVIMHKNEVYLTVGISLGIGASSADGKKLASVMTRASLGCFL